MAYAVYFLFMGFASELPWNRCSHDYNGPNCYSLPDRDTCINTEDLDSTTPTVWWNKTCTDIGDYCMKAGETEYSAFPEESPFYNNSCFNPMDGTVLPVENVTFYQTQPKTNIVPNPTKN